MSDDFDFEDDRGFLKKASDNNELQTGFDFGDLAAMAQRAQSQANQRAILQEQKEINQSLKKQEKEQERIAGLPKCPMCASPVEVIAKICPNCKAPVVIVGPLTRNYFDSVNISGSGHLIFNEADATDQFKELGESLKRLHTEAQEYVVSAMSSLAKSALPLTLLQHPDAAVIRKINSTNEPKKGDTNVAFIEKLLFLLIGFGIMCAIGGVGNLLGIKPDNTIFGLLLLGSFIGIPLALILQKHKKLKQNAKQQYSSDKLEHQKLQGEAKNFLKSYGLKPLDELKKDFSDAKAAYAEVGNLIQHFHSDCQVFSNCIHDYDMPPISIPPIEAAFVKNGQYRPPPKGLGPEAIKNILSACEKFISIPALSKKSKDGIESSASAERISKEYWVLRDDGKINGPFSGTQIKNLVRGGKITQQMKLSTSKNGPWKKFAAD